MRILIVQEKQLIGVYSKCSPCTCTNVYAFTCTYGRVYTFVIILDFFFLSFWRKYILIGQFFWINLPYEFIHMQMFSYNHSFLAKKEKLLTLNSKVNTSADSLSQNSLEMQTSNTGNEINVEFCVYIVIVSI